jgi:hypothetical protein
MAIARWKRASLTTFGNWRKSWDCWLDFQARRVQVWDVRRLMKKYLTILLVPIVATVSNALLSPLYGLLPGFGGDIVFNLFRICIWVFAGWRLASFGGYGVWKSAWSGAILLFIDHPIIKGGYFLIHHRVQAFEGVLISYCMLWFVPVAFAAFGAGIGKRRNTTDSPDTTNHAA